jgi:hypothetical protein
MWGDVRRGVVRRLGDVRRRVHVHVARLVGRLVGRRPHVHIHIAGLVRRLVGGRVHDHVSKLVVGRFRRGRVHVLDSPSAADAASVTGTGTLIICGRTQLANDP